MQFQNKNAYSYEYRYQVLPEESIALSIPSTQYRTSSPRDQLGPSVSIRHSDPAPPFIMAGTSQNTSAEYETVVVTVSRNVGDLVEILKLFRVSS